MKKLFMLSLAALVFAPVVYAQQPAQSSELAKFAPPMIPHPIAAYIPITPEKNACVMCHIPGEPGMKVAKGSPISFPIKDRHSPRPASVQVTFSLLRSAT